MTFLKFCKVSCLTADDDPHESISSFVKSVTVQNIFFIEFVIRGLYARQFYIQNNQIYEALRAEKAIYLRINNSFCLKGILNGFHSSTK